MLLSLPPFYLDPRPMHAKELLTVRFAMLALFSGLMVIYLLLYQIKGEKIINELAPTQTSEKKAIITGYTL